MSEIPYQILTAKEVIAKLKDLEEGGEFYFRFPEGMDRRDSFAQILKATRRMEHTFVALDRTGLFHAIKTSFPKR